MAEMIEFLGICGSKICINRDSVVYIQEAVVMGFNCTLICFKNGKKMYIDKEYSIVKDMLMEG